MKTTRLPLTLVLFLAGALLVPAVAHAQAVFGTISGTVSDSTGAVVPGTTVRVINVNTGEVRTLKTNEAGIYTASSLVPGDYRIEAEAPGFKLANIAGLSVAVNANLKVDVTLQVGVASQRIDVTAEATVLNTQQSNLGQTFEHNLLTNLPIQSAQGRSFFNLVELSAGVSVQKGEMGYDMDNMRINGGRPRNDDYLLDGTSIQQPVWGGQAIDPSVDSIQEFRVETNNLSAEYGKVSGGVITAVTRSGTNNFHGSAYEYLRNDALNARDYFLSPDLNKLPFRYNEFGGTIGGPALRNKLFFFSDYQGIRSNTSNFSTGYIVPSPAFKTGDLSAVGTPIIDPRTGQAFAGNRIPQNRFSAVSQKILPLWPDPSPGGTCANGVCDYFASTGTGNRVDRTNTRVDYNLSAKDRVFGVYHYQYGMSNETAPFPNPMVSSWYQGNPAKSLTAAWTHTFTPSMLNDFRFGWAKRNPSRVPWGYGKAGPADFGMSGFPECTLPNSGGKCGTPDVRVAGYTEMGSESMLFEPAGNISFTNTLSKTFGKHTLKVGGEIRRYWIDNIQPNRISGEFLFSTQNTGNAFADFLLGMTQQAQVEIQDKYLSSRMTAQSYFVQDDWKLTPRLTANLGFRYQIDGSWHEINHLAAGFNPYTLRWEVPGVNMPEGNLNNDYREFGPRLGFAWNARGGLVVRGGYAIMYPGTIGHGRGGDGEGSPNILARSSWTNVSWDSLPAISAPDPSRPLTIQQAGKSLYTNRYQRQTYTQQWNLTVEKQVARDTLFALSYIGSKGTRLPTYSNYNICQATAQQVMAYGFNLTGIDSPHCAPGNGILDSYGGNYVYNGYQLVASSIYHGMTARLEKRFSKGFSLLGSFTWSKLIDNASSDWAGFGSLDMLPQDYYNQKAERAVSAGDVPKRLSVVALWELPAGKGRRWVQQGLASQVLGGWQVSGIFTAQSGGPVGVQDSGWGYCNPARLGGGNRPFVVGDPLPSGFNRTLNQWFNTQAFDWRNSCPAPNLVGYPGLDTSVSPFGNAPRFMSRVRSPGLNNLDFSLAKSVRLPLGEAGRLTVQADFFNFLNHPQFAPPGMFDDATFGRITSTRTNMRIVQLGLHLHF